MKLLDDGRRTLAVLRASEPMENQDDGPIKVVLSDKWVVVGGTK